MESIKAIVNSVRRMNRSDSSSLIKKYTRFYITGEGVLDVGARIMKLGKSTGSRSGRVDFIRFDVKLQDSKCLTSEYTVTSSRNRQYFSEEGDSGAAVLGTGGKLKEMILDDSEGLLLVSRQEGFGYINGSYLTPWTVLKRRMTGLVGKEVGVFILSSDEVSADGKTVF